MKLFIYILFAMMVTACGGSNSDSSNNGNENSPGISLESMVGIWDATSESEGDIAEIYYSIKENGEWIEYFYQGDSLDNSENCYTTSKYTVEHLGDNEFEITFSEDESNSFNISIDGNDLVFINSDSTFRFSKSSLLESDFSPLCDE
ncbi:hypothetical protein A9R00_11460 [Oleispira antarctica]|uniref:Lipocalin-like domain-containing protein n=1 Tax=Oleispira antarctica TaxID=188908 RepID=A0A1Y5HNF7_OLEAN|nr:hypothetical protein A9R00_11460 [Oleispira antarctica]